MSDWKRFTGTKSFGKCFDIPSLGIANLFKIRGKRNFSTIKVSTQKDVFSFFGQLSCFDLAIRSPGGLGRECSEVMLRVRRGPGGGDCF